MRNVSKDVSFRPNNLFCKTCGLYFACSFFLLPLLNLFRRVFVPTFFTAVFNFFWTNNNIWKISHSNFQKVGIYAFSSWEKSFTQNWNCGSPNTLCNCTESPLTLSTNTSKERNLYLSWTNHPVTSFRLELKVGGFQHIKARGMIWQTQIFFPPFVALKSMSKIWKNFWAVVWNVAY